MHGCNDQWERPGILAGVWLCSAVLAVCALAWRGEAVAQPIPISNCQTIGTSGSYVLTQNLTTTGTCLTISADSVTIDLNGFSIVGHSTSGSGIRVNSTSQVLEVHDGMFQNFPYSGAILQTNKGLVFAKNLIQENAGSRVAYLESASRTVRVQGGTNSYVYGGRASEDQAQAISAVVTNRSIATNWAFYYQSIDVYSGMVSGSIAADNPSGTSGIFLDGSWSFSMDSVARRSPHGFGMSSGSSLLVNNLAGGNSIDGFATLNSSGGQYSALFGNASFGNVTDGFNLLCPGFIIGNSALNNTPNLTESGADCLDADNLAP